jgi:hypothetical protein
MTAPQTHAFAPLVEVLLNRRDEIADRALAAATREIPVYAGLDDATLEGVRANVAYDLGVVGRLFAAGGLGTERMERLSFVTEADRDHLHSVASRRARQGVPLADFLHAYRVSQRVIWQELRASALGAGAQDALLDVVEVLLEILDYRMTQAGEAYLAAQQTLVADSERVRRDLLEDLLAGREPATGERLAAATSAGLDATNGFVLIAARTVGPGDDQSLGIAASVLRRAAADAVTPLAVVRQREVVLIRALQGTGIPPGLITGIGAAHAKLREDGISLAVGVSTAHAGTRKVPEAYREAYLAIEPFREIGGFVALPGLSAFDYLTLRRDPTTTRLVADGIRQFVAEDLETGGTIINTLREYVAADMNARVAADRLFIHINTVHYRLGRIAEKTGYDMRRLADLVELLIAIRLATPERAAIFAPEPSPHLEG